MIHCQVHRVYTIHYDGNEMRVKLLTPWYSCFKKQNALSVTEGDSSQMAENCTCKMIQSFRVDLFYRCFWEKKRLWIDSGQPVNVYHLSRAHWRHPGNSSHSIFTWGKISHGLLWCRKALQAQEVSRHKMVKIIQGRVLAFFLQLRNLNK